ncbi:hypothetical protein HOD30_05410 [Candidatus Peregrinibacteria bacterium]|jgi:hypothetical protein|nr:hypothetical protein [Candidatus Peregrinibacteria bacterium]MBT4631459.1 hypothetical protein [Candidatus Peregrinibacteria bacterium]MBT5516508.1 hypothetical protein [Candidatus Peregrinibacteria bacterium]MBT5823848.1 hypothetical protein [Candidatus Peregrinibacteria bacterium]
MSDAEHIEGFEEQIEKSLDLRIDELELLDEEKSKTLTTLKGDILASIKQDRENDPNTSAHEEAYSEDLQITNGELEEIFEATRAKYPELFTENRVEDYFNFKELIGFDSGEKINYEPTFHKISLFGKEVTLVLPLSTNKDLLNKYKLTLNNLQSRVDLAPYITAQTQLIPISSNRIELTAQIEGKPVKYVALLYTPHTVLRVDEEPSIEQKKEWGQAHVKAEKTYYTFRKTLLADPDIDSDSTWELFDAFDEGNLNESEVPQKYRQLYSELAKLKKEEQELAKSGSTRILYDEESQIKIRETNAPDNTSYFTHDYLNEEGDTAKKIEYSGSYIEEYNSDSKLIVAYDYDYDNGVLKYKESGGQRDFYGTGKIPVLSLRLLPEDEDGDIQSLMIGPNETELADFQYEKEHNPKLTESEYLEKLKAFITTADQYFVFEEQLMEDSNLSVDTVDKLRLYGKEITGITEKEAALETRYNFRIETETWRYTSLVTCSRFPISTLDLKIDELTAKLAEYPDTFMARSTINSIYIFDNWVLNGEKGDPHSSTGGIQMGAGMVGYIDIATFDHELLHSIDHGYGELAFPNEEWGVIHGEDYEEHFGQEGHVSDPRPTGHPSTYGMIGGIDEDQAEMAKALMNNDRNILDRLDSEPALKDKAIIVKNFFFILSEGRMDKQYWKDKGGNVTIDDTYWERREAAQDFQASLAVRFFEFIQSIQLPGHEHLDSLRNQPFIADIRNDLRGVITWALDSVDDML